MTTYAPSDLLRDARARVPELREALAGIGPHPELVDQTAYEMMDWVRTADAADRDVVFRILDVWQDALEYDSAPEVASALVLAASLLDVRAQPWGEAALGRATPRMKQLLSEAPAWTSPLQPHPARYPLWLCRLLSSSPMIDVAAANASLFHVYESAWPALSAVVRETPGASGVHLVRIPDGVANAPVRVAIVGQQTAGWGALESVLAQLDHYPAEGGVEAKKHTPFWRAARQVTDALNGCEGLPVVWTNLVAVDVDRKQSPTRVRDAIRAAVPPHGLLRHVLEAAHPDAVVFLTGPSGYYEWEMDQQFPGVVRVPLDGQAPRALVQIEHDALPAASFRTYHPAYLQRSGQWDLLDALVRDVRQVLP